MQLQGHAGKMRWSVNKFGGGAVLDTERRERVAKEGGDIYDRVIRPLLKPEDDGKFVAIDIKSEEFEVDADDYAAVERLRTRLPSAEIWLELAGQPTAYVLRALS